MAENQNSPNVTETQGTTIVATEFLKGTETAEKDALYADLFQQNENGEISRKQKKERSILEIWVRIMSFLVPVVMIVAIFFSLHVFIRGQENNSFAENYPFLCKYFHYDIEASDEEKGCKTAKLIEDDFISKTKTLEKNIINQLAVFIPIKISASLGESSEEVRFIRETFESKNNYNEIIAQFEKIKKSSQALGKTNIICNNITVARNEILTAQCDIYGGKIGDTDANSEMWSSRIEAIRFIEKLSKTQDSHFIMEVPQTALPVVSTADNENISNIFATKTTINLSLRYIPFTPKI